MDYDFRSRESAPPSETADLLVEKLDKAIYCPTALTTKQIVTDIVSRWGSREDDRTAVLLA